MRFIFCGIFANIGECSIGVWISPCYNKSAVIAVWYIGQLNEIYFAGLRYGSH